MKLVTLICCKISPSSCTYAKHVWNMLSTNYRFLSEREVILICSSKLDKGLSLVDLHENRSSHELLSRLHIQKSQPRQSGIAQRPSMSFVSKASRSPEKSTVSSVERELNVKPYCRRWKSVRPLTYCCVMFHAHISGKDISFVDAGSKIWGKWVMGFIATHKGLLISICYAVQYLWNTLPSHCYFQCLACLKKKKLILFDLQAWA